MAPPGDLYVVVRVGRHAQFGRAGAEPDLTVPVTFAEAALGHDHHRAHPRRAGDAAGPAGHLAGHDLRVRGRGVPAGEERGKPGDLLVTVDVTVPEDLTDEQRSAVETMAAVLDGAAEPEKAEAET